MDERRAAIYCRISDDKAGAGLGVSRQREDCVALAERLGWAVVDVYTDNDISAYSGKRRPEYERMLADLKRGRVDAVIAWHPDRLHRRPAELESFITAVEAAGAPIKTVTAGDLDLSTPSGRMVARMLGAAARHEVEHAIERAQRKRRQMAEAGVFRGGARPFGYEADGMTVREDEAAELRDAAGRVLAGDSVASIANDWNARGIATSRGGQWSGMSVRRTLTRMRNAALIEHEGTLVGAAQWPALLDEPTYAGVRAVLGDGSPLRQNRPRAERLLSGIARCGVEGCDGTLRGGGTSVAGQHIYRCKHTPHLKRAADPIDRHVEAIVVDILARPESAGLLGGPGDGQAVSLHQQAAGARARLDELGEMFAAGEIDRAQVAAATKRIRAELAEVESALADLSAGTVLDGLAGNPDADAVWPTLPIERRRAVIDAVATVTVMRGKRGGPGGSAGFDPASIRVEEKRPR